MTYREVMKKKAAAGLMSGLGILAAHGIQTAGDLLSGTGAYVLAAAMLGGYGLGWLGAKVTAHSEEDMETAQKAYENERLKADLGYLSAKTQQEFDAQQRKQAPKEAYVFGR